MPTTNWNFWEFHWSYLPFTARLVASRIFPSAEVDIHSSGGPSVTGSSSIKMELKDLKQAIIFTNDWLGLRAKYLLEALKTFLNFNNDTRPIRTGLILNNNATNKKNHQILSLSLSVCLSSSLVTCTVHEIHHWHVLLIKLNTINIPTVVITIKLSDVSLTNNDQCNNVHEYRSTFHYYLQTAFTHHVNTKQHMHACTHAHTLTLPEVFPGKKHKRNLMIALLLLEIKKQYQVWII